MKIFTDSMAKGGGVSEITPKGLSQSATVHMTDKEEVFSTVAGYLLGLRKEGQPLVLVRSRWGLFSCVGRPSFSKPDPSMAHVGAESKVHGGAGRQEWVLTQKAPASRGKSRNAALGSTTQ